MQIEKFHSIGQQLKEDFEAAAIKRSAYALRHFVVNQHLDTPYQWFQCVIELRQQYFNLKTMYLDRQQLELKLRYWRLAGALFPFKIKRFEIQLEALVYDIVGREREFWALYNIYEAFDKRFTYDEIEAGQREHYLQKFKEQAKIEGRVSPSLLEVFRQMDIDKAELPALLDWTNANS